jgi:hypothetical protein
MRMATFADRFVGALKLDTHTFEEVEADQGALGQAIAVVVLSSLAAAIGSAGLRGSRGIIYALIGALAGWVIWAGLTYLIGTRVLPTGQTRSDLPEMLRTTGFAAAPGVIRVLGILPVLGWLAFAISGIWMLAAFVVAVRQALDYTSTWRAIGVCLIGWIAYGLVSLIVLALARV